MKRKILFTKVFNDKISLTAQDKKLISKTLQTEWDATKTNNDEELKLELSRAKKQESKMTIKDLALEMRAGFAQVKQEIAEIKQDVAEVKQDVAELKRDVAEVKQDLADFKLEVRQEFNNLYEKNPSLNR